MHSTPHSPLPLLKKIVLLYGILGGVLIAALTLIEYRFFLVLEPLPVALIISLVSAGVLSRRRPVMARDGTVLHRAPMST